MSKKDKKKVAVYNYTLAQLDAMLQEKLEKQARVYDEIMEQKVRQAIDGAFTGTMAVCVASLADEFGWGETRLKRLCERVDLKFDCIVGEPELLNSIQCDVEKKYRIAFRTASKEDKMLKECGVNE